MKISWSELGDPTSPGPVYVPGLGRVHVKQQEIDEATKAGGNPRFTLIRMTTAKDDAPQYHLGIMD